MTAIVDKETRTSKRYRKPNALKHGAFSSVGLLPWESPEEFEELRRGLIDQYQPKGPLQQECLRDIASLMWRKRRVQQKRLLEVAAAIDRVENRVLWEDPPPLFDTNSEKIQYQLLNRSPRQPRPQDDYEQLLAFSASLFRSIRGSLLDYLTRMLPKEFADHLEEKCPKSNYEDSDEWVVALKREVDDVLLPMVRAREPKPKYYYETAANLLTEDRLLGDLAVEERFDVAIDRLLKRFFSLQMAHDLNERKKPKELTISPPSVQLPSADPKPADPVTS
ncbi:hypothetical protein C2U70_30230 [Bradyrhizobium guangdongense]|nr:hypothetical protein C2U70_30230 [Bradyrhizobium guangdongense]